MKKAIILLFLIITTLSLSLSGCATFSKKSDYDRGRWKGRMTSKEVHEWYLQRQEEKNWKKGSELYYQSLGLIYDRIANDTMITDGYGLLFEVTNKSTSRIVTYIMGPIPPELEIPEGEVNVDIAKIFYSQPPEMVRKWPVPLESMQTSEIYLPPGKYIAISYIRGNPVKNGWCIIADGQIKTSPNGKKVHAWFMYDSGW